MKVSFAAQTHLGKQRNNNEDNYFVLDKHNLFVVADGMGGHASGEVASLMAVEVIANYFIESQNGQLEPWPCPLDDSLPYDQKRLSCGIKLANRQVHEVAQRGGRYHGMGTTIVSLFLGHEGAQLAHVGDSRGYLLRNGSIQQLTDDHSLVNEYMKLHNLTPADVANFSHKNVIVRALGLGDDVDVDVQAVEPEPGDTYLLCSDGLTDMVEDDKICELMHQADGDLTRACELLVQSANDEGGNDNITVVLVSILA